MADLAVIKERLRTRETVPTGRGCLERGIQKYKAFLDLIRARNEESDASLEVISDEQISLAMGDLRREIMLHQLEIRKLALVEKAIDIDKMNCEGNLEDLEDSINMMRQDLLDCKQKLASERLVRSRREEYEALSKSANLSVSQKISNAKKLEMKLSLDNLRSEEARTQEEIDVKQKQFSLLIQSIYDLQATIANDSSSQSASGAGLSINDTQMIDVVEKDKHSQNFEGGDISVTGSMEEGETR